VCLSVSVSVSVCVERERASEREREREREREMEREEGGRERERVHETLHACKADTVIGAGSAGGGAKEVPCLAAQSQGQ
jgi:hypothetical protein